MPKVNLLDPDFGAESEDDADFKPAPADESDQEAAEDADDGDTARLDGKAIGLPVAVHTNKTDKDADEEISDADDDDIYQEAQKPYHAHAKANGKLAKSDDAASNGVSGGNDGLTQGEKDQDEEKGNSHVKDDNERDDGEGEHSDGGDGDDGDDDEEDGEDGDDGDDDEEDDDDDEDDEEEVQSHRRKRRKERGVHGLFDMEAMVDEGEEDEGDEEDELREGEGFIVDTHPDDVADLPAGRDGDDRQHRELDRRREVEASLDAERQAELLRKRYRRNRVAPTDSIAVPKRLLLPSVEDPGIYGVKCKPGKEREVVMAALKRGEEREDTMDRLPIMSVFERRNAMPGYIYVETRKPSDVLEALQGMSNVYPRKSILVPIKEMPELLRTKSTTMLEPGSYVRIKRGKYQGDLAQVDSVSNNGLEIHLRIVPRLDYGLNEDTNAPMPVAKPAPSLPSLPPPTAAMKRKRFGPKKIVKRVPAKLFSEVDAKKKHSKYLAASNPKGTWIYQGDDYRDGFLMKDFTLPQLQTENVNPTLEEISWFAGSMDDSSENVDLKALADSMKATTASAAFVPGDIVEVYDGEQRGVWGQVSSLRSNLVSITVTDGELQGKTIDVPFQGVRKRFQDGDHVKIIGGGRYRDEVGMVVKIDGDKVTLLSDQGMQEITVFNRDLRKTIDSGGLVALGKFDLFDLVQIDPTTVGVIVKIDRDLLQVLDQNGSVRSMMPSQVMNKPDQHRFAVATDKDGSELRKDDVVREAGGEGRQGNIIHIHRAFVFVRSKERTENAGIFVTRANTITTIAAKGGRTIGKSVDLSRMNPAMQLPNGMDQMMMPPPMPSGGGGRDRWVDETVSIRAGDQKGSIGVVRNVCDGVVTVAMHSGTQVLGFKDSFILVDKYTGRPKAQAPMNGGRGRYGGGGGGGGEVRHRNYGGATQSRVPENWQGSRTPMAASGLSNGGRTPAWASLASSGSRTPAWKQGGATANPYPSNGGKTPAYAPSNRTAYGGPSGIGGDPFSMGSKTPAYGPSDPFSMGAKTPAYGPSGSSWGGETPGYGNGSSGLGGSRTPAYAGGTSSTSGGGDTFTPGTPGPAWGGSSVSGSAMDDQPRYSTPSP